MVGGVCGALKAKREAAAARGEDPSEVWLTAEELWAANRIGLAAFERELNRSRREYLRRIAVGRAESRHDEMAAEWEVSHGERRHAA